MFRRSVRAIRLRFPKYGHTFPIRLHLSGKTVELSRVTSRGRTTIPKRIREAFDLREGDVIAFQEESGNLLVRKLIPEHGEFLKGIGDSFSEWFSPEDELAWRDL